jgi:hypothetical protein
MHYVGVDYHKKSSYVTVVDEQGRVVKEGQLANTPAALAASLGGHGERRLCGAGGGPELARDVDWLEELVAEVTLAKRLLTIACRLLTEGRHYRPAAEQARTRGRISSAAPVSA